MRSILGALLAVAVSFAANAQNQPAQNQTAPQAAEEPQVEVTTNQDWHVACRDTEVDGKAERLCQMQQTLEEVDSGEPFLRITIHYPRDNGDRPVMRIFAPLGVLLRPGIVMQIDDGEELRLPFQVCLGQPAACIVEGAMEQDIVQLMKAGISGEFRLSMVGNRQVEAPFSLKGFTKSINSLK